MKRTFFCIFAATFLVGCGVAPGPQASGGPSAAPSVSAAPSAPAGWKAFTTRDESIAVQVPDEAKSQPDEAMPGTYHAAFVIEGKDKQSRSFEVGWILVDEPDAEKWLQEYAGNASVQDKKEIDVAGHKGLEAVLTSLNSRATVRIVAGEGRVFLASHGVSPVPSGNDANSEAKTFLDSFQPQLDRSALEDRPAAITWKEWKSKDGSLTCMVPDDFAGRGNSGASGRSGRLVRVSTAAAESGAYKSMASELEKASDVTSKKAVERNGLKGFEVVRTGIDSVYQNLGHPEWFQTHSLVLVGKKHIYRAEVGGLAGDKTLEADARKVFDSLKTTP